MWRPSRSAAAALLVSACVALLPDAAARPAAANAPVRALFLGDSLMAGTGARPVRPVMARVVANRLGWQVTVDAVPGSGYTVGGRPRHSRLGERLARHQGRFDVVLVEGGTNDLTAGSDPATMYQRVEELTSLATALRPSARLVLMGAYDPPGVTDPRRVAADRIIAAVAAAHGLAFFSPIDGRWTPGLPRRPFLSPDGLHPTEVGYGELATHLVAALRSLRVTPHR